MSRKLILSLGILLVFVTIAACAPAGAPQTVTVVETVIVEKEVVEEVTVVETVEVEVEVPVAMEPSVLVEFWTTDNEEERVQVYEAVAEAYMAQNPDV
ncbi:MAG: hypothetical protein OES12_02650, partial [Anaerolineae bacterium]|nr:hypothetical protein [Anaerolineae bacterium]